MKKRSINIAYFIQFRSSKLIFVVKTTETRKSCPMLHFDSFVIIFAAIVQVFKGRKLFKWGNYSGEETIQGKKLLIIMSFWLRKLFKRRKVFKGGNYMRKYGIWNRPWTTANNGSWIGLSFGQPLNCLQLLIIHINKYKIVF